MKIRLNNPIVIKDFYDDIEISDDETKIKLSVEAAKEVFEQLEDTLYDETESHKYMEHRIDKQQERIEELESQVNYYEEKKERYSA